jgi:O-antigen ligase
LRWLLRQERLQCLATIGLAAGVAGVFALIYHPLLSARAGVGGESVELRSISDRAVYSDLAFRAIGESPILGVGLGNFAWRASYDLQFTSYDLRGQPAHHVFLSAWAELGIVGYGLAALALLLGVEAALRNASPYRLSSSASDHDPANTTASTALLGGVIALMVIGLLDHYPWTLIQFQIAWWGLLAVAGRKT